MLAAGRLPLRHLSPAAPPVPALRRAPSGEPVREVAVLTSAADNAYNGGNHFGQGHGVPMGIGKG